jgi:hypothetical protein
MLPSGALEHNTAGHQLKMRRVCTVDQSPHVYNPYEQSFNDDSPYFKSHTQVNTPMPHKKANFICSLITKLKSVERPELFLN